MAPPPPDNVIPEPAWNRVKSGNKPPGVKEIEPFENDLFELV